MVNKVFNQVKEIIIDKLGVDYDEVNMCAHIQNDLGADSLDVVELIMEFEKEFEIDIPDEVAESVTTVGDIVRYLKSAIKVTPGYSYSSASQPEINKKPDNRICQPEIKLSDNNKFNPEL